MGRAAGLLSPRTLVHLLVLRPVLRLLFGVGVEGRAHLAGLERFILVANHNSHLDALLLFQALPWWQLRQTHPVAAYEYFSRSRALFFLARHLLDPIWIVRGARAQDPLDGMRDRLRQGHSLVLFPEGTRGAPGQLAPFQAGVGQLALEFPEVPVVPAFLAGAEKALPKSSAFPIPVWTRVIVGPPQVMHGSRRDIAAALEAMVRQLADSEMGRRHRRVERSRQVPAIAVVGIDGSGKSTLARNLARRLSAGGRVGLVTDDVEFFAGGHPEAVQPLISEKLREVIGRRAKRAGSLQSYKVPKLAELLLRDHVAGEVRRWYAPDAIVLDGSPLLNIAAWGRLYREEAFTAAICASALAILSGQEGSLAPGDPVHGIFPELAAWRRLHLPALARPDVVLFLDVDPAVAMGRIRARGEAQQVHETEAKLGQLREGYRTACRVVEEDWRLPARILEPGGIDAVVDAALRELAAVEVVAPLLRRQAEGGSADA
ncbi:MAG: 1-acyl-sn-glycerol-3-phosphate acyltransferase [Gemmatimonadota bacterium]